MKTQIRSFLLVLMITSFSNCKKEPVLVDKFCVDKYLQFVDTTGNDVFTDASVLNLRLEDFYVTEGSDTTKYYIADSFRRTENGYILPYGGIALDTTYFHFGSINVDTLVWVCRTDNSCDFYVSDIIYNGDTLKHYDSCNEVCAEKDEVLQIVIEGDGKP